MSSSPLEQVRRFNRLVTQRAGALDNHYLGRGRPLGQARLLFDIGRDGADIRDLRQTLGLDSGYLSRLLRALERQGLVHVEASTNDGRVRRAHLTPQGQAEVETYDRLSDLRAQSLLERLDDAQQTRLLHAMAEVERGLRAASVTVGVERPDSVDAQWCMDRYYQDISARFDTGYDPAQAMPTPVKDFMPPKGAFVLARLDGKPVGCGALKRPDALTGEIKRVWTDPSARGLGVARRIMGTLEGLARDAGLTSVRLDTNRALTEAMALYLSLGYAEVPAFNTDPYAHHWLAKRLSD